VSTVGITARRDRFGLERLSITDTADPEQLGDVGSDTATPQLNSDLARGAL